MSVLEKLSSRNEGLDRRALGREVANLFFAAEKKGLARAQIDSFGYILSRLLNDIEQPGQVDLSERMSHSTNAPRELVKNMAYGEMAVAAPVIERSPVLTEDDMVALASNSDKEHRLALARRQDLTSKVTDRLIDFEESEVMRSVAANTTADISGEGFSTLARHGGDDTALLELLMQRADLPEATASTILPFLDAGGRERLMRLMADNGKTFDDMVAKAKTETSVKKISARKLRLEAKAMAKSVEAGTKTLADVAGLLAQAKRAKDLALVFSEISMLPESKTFNAIVDTNGELLAMMCRAFDLPFAVYKDADLMRRGILNIPDPGDWDVLSKKYEAIIPESARKTLRFVSVLAHVS